MASINGRGQAGHVLGGILGVAHVAAIGAAGEEGDAGPPLAVLVVAAALGVAIVALLVRSWRQDSRGARRVAAVLLLLAALGTLPGLLVAGVHVARQVGAGAVVLLTIATVLLLFSPQRPAADPVHAL